MKYIKPSLVISLLLFVNALIVAQPVVWKIQEDYTVKFSGKRVEGFFRGLEGDILFDENSPESSRIIAGINANTLNTGIGLKNKHAKSKKGLNAGKFTMITFVSTQIIKTGNSYEAIGNLTVKGTSKEIKLPFTFERIESDAVFKGKFSMNPKDYHITRHGTPDNIEIELTVRVTAR